MANMRKLAPRLAKLKETYGDDKQKMGQKTMELYKQIDQPQLPTKSLIL
jgi:YidC/Oxa1 family membrane protein insertase